MNPVCVQGKKGGDTVDVVAIPAARWRCAPLEPNDLSKKQKIRLSWVFSFDSILNHKDHQVIKLHFFFLQKRKTITRVDVKRECAARKKMVTKDEKKKAGQEKDPR